MLTGPSKAELLAGRGDPPDEFGQSPLGQTASGAMHLGPRRMGAGVLPLEGRLDCPRQRLGPRSRINTRGQGAQDKGGDLSGLVVIGLLSHDFGQYRRGVTGPLDNALYRINRFSAAGEARAGGPTNELRT